MATQQAEDEEFPFATGERLLIRPLRLSDAPDIFTFRSNPEAMVHSTNGIPSEALPMVEDWIQSCLDEPYCDNFSILLLPSASSQNPALPANTPSPDQVIGNIGAIRHNEIGYMINPSFAGQGLASEALSSFMRGLFWPHIAPKRGYEEARAETDPEHGASIRVLENNGFVRKEVLQGNWENPVLGVRDTAVYVCRDPNQS